jgi:hypothetical protein
LGHVAGLVVFAREGTSLCICSWWHPRLLDVGTYIQVGVKGVETMMLQSTDVDVERRSEGGQASRFSKTPQGLNENPERKVIFSISARSILQSNRVDVIDFDLL